MKPVSNKKYPVLLSVHRGLKSFTLVELLIVIAILAILAAAVVIVINPGEMIAEARDSQRITDIKSVKDAIDLFIIDNPAASLGTANRVYISIPDTASNCPNLTSFLPALPATWQYVCATSANLRNTDSTGWIPLNLSLIKGGSPIPYLPTDPQNDATLTKYYQYIPGGAYELTALLESEKQAKTAAKDGGTDSGRLEVGNDLNLWRTASGLIGYWPFEGTGAILNNQTAGLQDLSGNLNNGAAVNTNGTGMNFVTGKVGSAMQLDGVDDYVNVANGASLNPTAAITISLWINPSVLPASTHQRLVVKNSSTGYLLNIYGSTDESYIGGIHVAGSALSTNQWANLVTTIQGGNLLFYVNGVQVRSVAYTGAINGGSSNLTIGSENGSQKFTGLMDELLIYNRGLSASEIQSIYNAGK